MNYGTLQRALIVLVGLLNAAVGVFCIIAYGTANVFSDGNLPWFFLSTYLAAFGVLLVMANVSATMHESLVGRDGEEGLFGFLGHSISSAVFVAFIGTLGLGFGGFDSDRPDKGLPFIGGCISIGLALLAGIFSCCKEDGEQVTV